MLKKTVVLLSFPFLVLGYNAAYANENGNNAHIEGILIGTYQIASESRANGQDVENEGSGQFYMLGTMDMGPGTWHLELRGGTTPRDNGVSSFYGVNGTVGETLDPSGDGRIAATQFFYELQLGPGRFRAGLLDPAAVLDTNGIANDEYTQFLADAFVNNLSIGFPSFVLGGAYQGNVGDHVDYKLFLSSTGGLEDPADPTYSNVVHLSDDGKGAFSAGELGWHSRGYMAKIGLWYDTSDHPRLGGSPGSQEDDYGAYALAGGPAGAGRWNFRAGIANDEAQAAANFLSLAYALPFRNTTLGAAVARTGDSSHLGFDSSPIYQAEVYWRINVYKTAYITPDLQYVINSGFRSNVDNALVGGVRAGIEF